MTRAHIAIAHRVIDSLSHRNEAFTADVAPNASFHLQGRALHRQQFRQIAVTDLQFALPDLRMSCDGTHAGVLFDVPASGENISFSVAMWLHIQGVQVVAVQLYWNKFAAQEALVAARQRAAVATTGSRAHPSVQ